jgi:hypothetical protein
MYETASPLDAPKHFFESPTRMWWRPMRRNAARNTLILALLGSLVATVRAGAQPTETIKGRKGVRTIFKIVLTPFSLRIVHPLTAAYRPGGSSESTAVTLAEIENREIYCRRWR